MPREPKRYGAGRPKPKETRPSAARRGYGKAWQKVSAGFLRRFPLCFYCGLLGRVVAAECVDHFLPFADDRELLFDAENLRSACLFHNTSKGETPGPEFVAKLLKEKA